MSTTSIRLNTALVDKAQVFAKAQHRTPPKQIEHWATIGQIMEDNPDLSYEFVRQLLIAKEEADSGMVEPYEFG
ncbi:TA system antitoxin ParD family protein [Psychrobacter lutiphocae]|uniref:TA system antitoxin ParD family protein n=1 Tax=Psychrobacter lutiphocae TaxID=540500 RepID=UPI00038120F0|nr:hypothetical protein [Psychrobacter lutiphocae]